MMAKTSNNLDDDTMNNIEQVNSVPIYLLTLVTILIDGPGVSNRQSAQPELTKLNLFKQTFVKTATMIYSKDDKF